MTDRLHEDDVRRIAEATADVLAERGLVAPVVPELVTAAEVGRRLGLSADYVRRHAAQLGGRKVGDGVRARWRFDPVEAAAAMNPSTGSVRSALPRESSAPSGSPAPARRSAVPGWRVRQRTGRGPAGGELDASKVPSMADLLAERRSPLDRDVGTRDDQEEHVNGRAPQQRSRPGDEE
jgi:hypothetical protein